MRTQYAAPASPDTMAAVAAVDLVKVYGSGDTAVRALDGVTVGFARAAFTAIMGPSGSGKSTLMHCLAGLDTATSGRALLGGTDLTVQSDKVLTKVRRERIGFVFQSFNLLARTSALENVELPLIYSPDGSSAKDREQKARKCLAIVGLEGREEHHPSQLSGGQQQRVAIARALINDPKLILADEPTGNLDTKTSEEVMAVFQRLNDDGKTVVLITHEQDIAEHAKRTVVFRDGRVVDDQEVARRRRAG
jgi:putative ABC transport system ATP-binding protein